MQQFWWLYKTACWPKPLLSPLQGQQLPSNGNTRGIAQPVPEGRHTLCSPA